MYSAHLCQSVAPGCSTSGQTQHLVLDGPPWSWGVRHQPHEDAHQRYSLLWQNCVTTDHHTRTWAQPWDSADEEGYCEETIPKNATEYFNDCDFQIKKIKCSKENKMGVESNWNKVQEAYMSYLLFHMKVLARAQYSLSSGHRIRARGKNGLLQICNTYEDQ